MIERTRNCECALKAVRSVRETSPSVKALDGSIVIFENQSPDFFIGQKNTISECILYC